MALFTIRVELHQAQIQHYLRLYANLAAGAVTDEIIADDGTKWKLPPGEYNYEGPATVNAVYNFVVGAAEGVGLPFAVVVSECVRRSWRGLEHIPP